MLRLLLVLGTFFPVLNLKSQPGRFGIQPGTSFRPFLATIDYELRPPNESLLESESSIVLERQKTLSKTDTADIYYWNAGTPAYRWFQIMTDIGNQYPKLRNGGRMAILHLAIFDVCAIIHEQKKKYDQKRPYEVHDGIVPIISAPGESGYLSERCGAAAAAGEIIKYYFPDAAGQVDSLVQKAIQSRINAGLQFPSDVQISSEIGLIVANKYIEYARQDRTNALWEGEVPSGEGLWRGNPGKKDPMKGQWKPYTLERADQFRPLPPPDFEEDMEELRKFHKENKISDIAWIWKTSPIWDDMLHRKIFEYGLDDHALWGTYIEAVFHVARYDAIIAAWEAKYHYWGIRPFQYAPTFKPILVETPNFPGYPAGHTAVAGSLSTVLSFFFPRDKLIFEELELECSESRFEGGVHFRVDNEEGLILGSKVGNQVLSILGKLQAD